MAVKMTQEDIMQLLEKLYDNSLNGIPKVSVPIEQLAQEYLDKNKDLDAAAQSFVKYQIAKCTTSGFLSGLGGLITLPVAIPANISSVLYVQMRMIACLAYMGGYDMQSDQVQTLVYACLAGISVDQIIKNMGIQFGLKAANVLVKKIPGAVLTKINQRVGFRFITKFGTKGVINISKGIPLIGGIVGGSFDFTETKIIADRAYKMFIKNDFSTSSKEEVIEIDDSEIIAEN